MYVCVEKKIQKPNSLGAVMNFTMNDVYLLALQSREEWRERQASSTRVLMFFKNIYTLTTITFNAIMKGNARLLCLLRNASKIFF